MKKIWGIALKDVGEAFRSRSTYIFMVIMVIFTFSYISGYNRFVGTLNSKQAIDDYSRSFLNSMTYVLPMMYAIFVCSIFATYSVIVDKAKRTIESILASPVSVKEVWMGKSLAVTLPSLVIGIIISILGYSIINLGFVMPKTGTFIVPDVLAIISAIIIVPLLVFAIVTVVINIQLIISNPRIANLVFTGIFILLVLSVNTLGVLGISINYFPLVYAGLIVICTLISLILARSLTTEKVILSSKM
jgi:ABC-2 type transport system permease protein